MPDTIDHLDPLLAAPADPPAEHDPFLLTEDEAICHHAHGLMLIRWGDGDFAAFRGEYVVGGPDATVLSHHPRLQQARVLAEPEAMARGIPLKHLIHFYVPTLDD
jgi:hypothetical protein